MVCRSRPASTTNSAERIPERMASNAIFAGMLVVVLTGEFVAPEIASISLGRHIARCVGAADISLRSRLTLMLACLVALLHVSAYQQLSR
jgi:hypothetical protein